jgi:hypothetical protein
MIEYLPSMSKVRVQSPATLKRKTSKIWMRERRIKVKIQQVREMTKLTSFLVREINFILLTQIQNDYCYRTPLSLDNLQTYYFKVV